MLFTRNRYKYAIIETLEAEKRRDKTKLSMLNLDISYKNYRNYRKLTIEEDMIDLEKFSSSPSFNLDSHKGFLFLQDGIVNCPAGLQKVSLKKENEESSEVVPSNTER